MRAHIIVGPAALAGLVVVAACSAGSDDTGFNGSGASSGDASVGAGGTVTGQGGGSVMDVAVNELLVPCEFADDQDHDGDGYSFAEGDCNDCDVLTNPGAFDVVGGVNGGESVDEDCDGTVDNEPTDCDGSIAINDVSGFNGAKAIGLCRKVDPAATGKAKTWGVLSAKYVKVDGTDGMNPQSHGIVPGFGAANVQQGASMLVLSSGFARAPGQQGWVSPEGADMNTSSGAPAGYPKESPACPGIVTGAVNDPAALELEIRVPTNANSFKFNFNFYTFEFPEYICSQYNDFFVTMLEPKVPSLPDGNISFDSEGNSISVNNALLHACQAQKAPPANPMKDYACPLGTALLQNTGFASPEKSGPHAATGWLVTQAAVQPGSTIKLRFAIWDSGDSTLDSTVLIDNFEWSVEASAKPVTEPVPNPK